MTNQTRIEWTGHTWNTSTGCSKISPGCKNCYAESLTPRLQPMMAPGYQNGFNLSLMPEPCNRNGLIIFATNATEQAAGFILNNGVALVPMASV